MNKYMTLLVAISAINLSGCQLSLDPEVLAERNRIAQENGLRHQRGDYSFKKIESYKFEFKFSKAIPEKEVKAQIYSELTRNSTGLNYRERDKQDDINVPGSELQLRHVRGLKVYPGEKFPVQHPDQAFMSLDKHFIFEYRDGEQWEQTEYKNLHSVRMWHFEVDIESYTGEGSDYNEYSVILLPIVHYTGAKYDGAVESSLTEQQAKNDVIARIASVGNLAITKEYTLQGEQKLRNDDVTAFANIRRILKSSFEQPEEEKQTDTERYGVVTIDDSVVKFSIYPYKSKAIVQYRLKYPFTYTASVYSTPNEYSEKQASKVVSKFTNVLNN